MIEESAYVVELGDGFVWVETQRKSTCGSCSVNKGCGTAVLSKVLGRYRNRMRALNSIPVSVGDKVVIGIRENALLIGSLAVYMLPLVFMMVIGFTSESVAAGFGIEQEWPGIAGGLSGLALGFMAVRRFSDRIKTSRDYQPVVIRKALN